MTASGGRVCSSVLVFDQRRERYAPLGLPFADELFGVRGLVLFVRAYVSGSGFAEFTVSGSCIGLALSDTADAGPGAARVEDCAFALPGVGGMRSSSRGGGGLRFMPPLLGAGNSCAGDEPRE